MIFSWIQFVTWSNFFLILVVSLVKSVHYFYYWVVNKIIRFVWLSALLFPTVNSTVKENWKFIVIGFCRIFKIFSDRRAGQGELCPCAEGNQRRSACRIETATPWLGMGVVHRTRAAKQTSSKQGTSFMKNLHFDPCSY